MPNTETTTHGAPSSNDGSGIHFTMTPQPQPMMMPKKAISSVMPLALGRSDSPKISGKIPKNAGEKNVLCSAIRNTINISGPNPQVGMSAKENMPSVMITSSAHLATIRMDRFG